MKVVITYWLKDCPIDNRRTIVSPVNLDIAVAKSLLHGSRGCSNRLCYSYAVGASGLPDIHEWLSLGRARGRSPSGLP